jgi:quercetin dioxygenase-like cupin family protein
MAPMSLTSVPHLRRALAPALVIVLAALGLVACGGSGSTPAPGADAAATTTAAGGDAVEPVVKEVLAQDATPPGAPGYTLTLMRYTIAPGAQLAPHVHPGVQMASIDRGTLGYTIVSGTAEVRRAGSQPAPVTGPTHLDLGPGDSVVEPFDMVHFGANEGAEPVVITATLLTETDQALSVAVTTTTTTAAAP